VIVCVWRARAQEVVCVALEEVCVRCACTRGDGR
jgi:hypothetical protein